MGVVCVLGMSELCFFSFRVTLLGRFIKVWSASHVRRTETVSLHQDCPHATDLHDICLRFGSRHESNGHFLSPCMVQRFPQSYPSLKSFPFLPLTDDSWSLAPYPSGQCLSQSFVMHVFHLLPLVPSFNLVLLMLFACCSSQSLAPDRMALKLRAWKTLHNNRDHLEGNLWNLTSF